MVRVRVILIAASIAVGSAAIGGSARADDSRAQSRALFTSGAAALDDGRPGDALRAFEAAYALFPHYSTLYNIGLCERALGRPLLAATSFKRFLDDGGDAIAADQRATAERLLREAEARIVVVRLQAAPGARVTVDGRAVDGPVVRLDPGDHVAEASADGYVPRRVPFSADAGDRPTIYLDLARKEDARPPAGGPAHVATAPAPGGESRLDSKVWVSTGIAAAGLLSGIVCGVVALEDSHVYNDPATSNDEAARRKSRGQTLRLVADVSFGVAILAGGAALYFATRPSPPPPRQSWITPVPWASDRAAGVALHGAWPTRLF